MLLRATTGADGLAGLDDVDLFGQAVAGRGCAWLAQVWRREGIREAVQVASPVLFRQVSQPQATEFEEAEMRARNPRYRAALAQLDAHVNALAHRRADRALERIARGQRPAFAEYDLFHGMTAIGAFLLMYPPGGDALGNILAYLVRLTEPLRADGRTLPGWWAFHDPNVMR